jgi:hypothetical protein
LSPEVIQVVSRWSDRWILAVDDFSIGTVIKTSQDLPERSDYPVLIVEYIGFADGCGRSVAFAPTRAIRLERP